MWTIIVLAFSAVISASEFESEDNGWIPVSSDVVYQQIRHGLVHVQPPRYTKAYDVQTLHTNPEILRFLTQEYQKMERKVERTRTDSDKQRSRGNGKVADFAALYDKNNSNEPSLETENKFNMENIFNPKKNATYNIIERKSKKLLFDDFFPETNENINVIEDKSTKDNSHTYEVKENINVEDEISQEETVEKFGYEYNRPDTKNLKNDLTKYLSKYNIKESDNLKNYALSRRPKVVNPPRNVEYKPLHFKVPYRYNNLNHLPVDPLLAVFLSNYGHYLQGQYGIQNHYNNLYGYLASNNIHNNRPFGHYKLFSDTDSSL